MLRIRSIFSDLILKMIKKGFKVSHYCLSDPDRSTLPRYNWTWKRIIVVCGAEHVPGCPEPAQPGSDTAVGGGDLCSRLQQQARKVKYVSFLLNNFPHLLGTFRILYIIHCGGSEFI